MNKFTRIISVASLAGIFLCLSSGLFAQDTKAKAVEDLQKVDNYREQIRRLVGFLEFSLNTLGSSETSTREKEVIINESYLKAFMNEKVQVEDDLDENREIFTYKDVQAYLKDVDFFFKEATFKIDVQDIQALTSDQGMAYFKVTANRNLQGTTVDDIQINNNKTRYIEINLDEDEQVLKIASIYTTRLNEVQELMTWWNGMPTVWKDFLGSAYKINDSLSLNRIDFLNDTTLLAFMEIPEIIQKESFVHIGSDSLLIIENDTILQKKYDTIPFGRNPGLGMVKEITKQESLNISGNQDITDLYPVDQMTDLKSLNISGSLINDLFNARNLNRLTSLNISGSGITDLLPIQYNTRIRELYLDSTAVNSLAPVQGFQDLKVLHLSHTLVNDLQPIRNLDSLRDLRLDYAPVSNLDPLGGLVNLENLSFSGTLVDSLNSIQYHISLKRIFFENTNIADLAPLGNLTNLQIIDADRTKVANLDPLGNLSSLDKIYCDQTLVTKNVANSFMAAFPNILVIYESEALTSWWDGLNLDWQKIFRGLVNLDSKPTTEQLHKLTLVTTINLEGNSNITSLDPLEKLTNLKSIQASKTLVSDISPLSELFALESLDFSETRISSLLPLEALVKLEQLDFSNTLVDSLNGLDKLANLRILTVDHTGINDLRPLMNCEELKFIYCDDTKVGKVDIDQFLDHNPECLIIYQTSLLKNWWNGLPSAWKAAFQKHATLDQSPTREQLHTLAGLTAIDLSGNREITALQPLTTLQRLEDLNLANGPHQDITPLADMVRLKKLNLSGNPVEDLTAISNLPQLTELDISNTAVAKLDAISSLVKLEQLNCSGTQIKKLDPLASLRSLKKLECFNTGISNLKPLTGLIFLKQLVCYNTKLNEKKVAAFKAEVPGVEVVFY